MKQCPCCNKFKYVEDFNKCAKRKDGLQYKCRQCEKEERQHPRRKRKQKIAQIKRDYKLGTSEYLKLYKSQKGLCAICGDKDRAKGKYLAIDHDHKSGIVRGLLCSNCNCALGLMGENVQTLTCAINYLKSNS